jgi:hypothetical protein
MEALQWAREHHCLWDDMTSLCAAMHGHLELLKWARANGCPWDLKTCQAAAVRGDLPMLAWARANDCPWDDHSIGIAAAENGCGAWQIMLAMSSNALLTLGSLTNGII